MEIKDNKILVNSHEIEIRTGGSAISPWELDKRKEQGLSTFNTNDCVAFALVDNSKIYKIGSQIMFIENLKRIPEDIEDYDKVFEAFLNNPLNRFDYRGTLENN